MTDLVDAYEYGRSYTTRLVPTPPAREGVLSQKDLTKPSCPACYRPGLVQGYCARCEASGAAARHRGHAQPLRVVAVPAKSVPPKWIPGQPRRQPYTMITPAEALAALQAYKAETGRVPSCSRWQAEKRRPSHHVMFRIYGSWAAALVAAGFDLADHPTAGRPGA